MIDYISRETVAHNVLMALHTNGEVMNAIYNTPAADVAPVVRGKWVEIKRPDINPITRQHGVYVGCSECAFPIPTDCALDFIDERDVKFCPNCGASMKEVSE